MAEPKLVDLHVLHFKPESLSSVRPETTPPPALETATSLLRSVPGVEALHLGRKLEDELQTTWVLATTWAARADANAFAASELWMPFRAALRSAVDGGGEEEAWDTKRVSFVAAPAEGADGDRDARVELAERVLGAECTEFVITFGSDGEYWDGVQAHVRAAVEAGQKAVPGFRGAVCGKVEGRRRRMAGDDEGGEGDTVVLVFGWESIQAHQEAAARGGMLARSVQENLKSGWTSFSMYHVNFRKL